MFPGLFGGQRLRRAVGGVRETGESEQGERGGEQTNGSSSMVSRRNAGRRDGSMPGSREVVLLSFSPITTRFDRQGLNLFFTKPEGRHMRKRRGFTLIELLVVIAIIA